MAGAPFASAQPIPIINPGFENGAPGQPPPGWRLSGAGYSAVVGTDAPPHGGQGIVISGVEDYEPRSGAIGVLRQQIDATPYRHRRLRLRAAVRFDPPVPARGELWLRVERPVGKESLLFSMRAPPVRAASWTDDKLDVEIPGDATTIAFGYLLRGKGAVRVDDFSIDDIGPAGIGNVAARTVSTRGLENLTAFARLYGYVRYFHPSDEAAGANWDALALDGVDRVETAQTPRALRQALELSFAPVAPGLVITNTKMTAPHFEVSSGKNYIAWRRRGLGEGSTSPLLYHGERVDAAANTPAVATLALPRGLVAYVPLQVVRGTDGRTLPRARAATPRSVKPDGFVMTGDDRTSRLADVVIAWNIFQHFYPYFGAARVDWRAQLPLFLNAAATDPDAAAFDTTLSRLMAALHDGHARSSLTYFSGVLPLRWAWIEDALVVTAVTEGLDGLRVGDVVTAIDGRPVLDVITETEATTSAATLQYLRTKALDRLTVGHAAEFRILSVLRADGTREELTVALTDGKQPSRATGRPATIADVTPDTLYVDLTRLDPAALEASVARLAAARAIVFDMRGYPQGAAFDLLRHLSDNELSSDAFNAPTYTQPDQRDVTYENLGWRMTPLAPRFNAKSVFLTDSSAISYAESILGVVARWRLGDIVGETTAGTNGDIDTYTLPTNHVLVWTGLKVLKADGSPHHGVGVAPTIAARRTLAGVRAGRDEVLEAGITALRP